MSRLARIGPVVVLVVSTALYAACFLPFFPNARGALGHDFGYFLPMLVEGVIQQKLHGVFSEPMFTPAFCGGMPFFANPQALPYHPTELLLFVVDPLSAIRITVVAAHVLSLASIYACARRGLDLDGFCSALAAVLFAWGTLVLDRLLAGHLVYLGYAPVSLAFLAMAIGARVDPAKGLPLFARAELPRLALGVVVLAAAFVLWVEMGAAVIVVPLALATGAFGCVCVLAGKTTASRALAVLVAGLVLGALVLAPRLSASLAFLSQVPRDLYDVPGYASFPLALRGIFTLLFLDGLAIEDPSLLIPFTYMEPERAYGIGPAGLVGFGGALYALARAPRAKPGAVHIACIAAIVAVLVVPVVLTVENASLASLVKATPILKSSVSFTRWYCLYAPLLALATALVVARVRGDAARAAIAVTLAGVTIAFVAGVDRSTFHKEVYDPTAMIALHARIAAGERAPDVTRIESPPQGRPTSFVAFNASFAAGASPVPCYEPLFGYGLERFPAKLEVGPWDLVRDGRVNLVDPRCYVFPHENGCVPGDRFRADDPAAVAFTRRETIPFAAPTSHAIALWLRRLALLLVVFVVVAIVAPRLRRGRREPTG